MTVGTEPLRANRGLAWKLVLGWAGVCSLGWGDPTPVFPKLDPVANLVNMQAVEAGQSWWRQPQEDWDGARRRVREDPDWIAWLERQQTVLETWMNGPAERVEWVTGWGHEFVSPRDGSYLTWTAEIPGEDRKTLSSPSDPIVEMTPAIFRAWVTKFRGRNMIRAKDAARLGRLLEDGRYLEWAAQQLDFYADHWREWPVQNRFYGPSRLFAQPLMDAAYLNHLMEAYRLLEPYADPHRRERWAQELFLPQARMLGESMARIHNIAGFLRAAAAHVALECGDEALWRETIDGPWGLRRQLEDGVTSDYFWFEQSIGYHEFIISGVVPLFHAVAARGRGAELAREMAIVRNMIHAPNAVRFADNTLPNPADNAALRLRYAPLNEVLRKSYRVLPDPLSQQEARTARTWHTLIDPPPVADEVEVVMPAVTSSHLESTRMAQLKAEGWQVFFHYGQLTGSHAQAELLNFEAFYGKTPITLDPHTVGYGSPLHAEYFTQGLCHNVPLIDGLGSRLPEDEVVSTALPQRGEMVRFDPERKSMTARQSAYRDGVRVERSLAIKAGALHDELTMRATGNNVRFLGLALHLQAVVRERPDMESDPEFATDRPVAFQYWQGVKARQFQDHATFRAVCPDGRELEIRFALPGEFTVFVGSVPDSPVPQRRMAFYVETRGTAATFRTVITPQD